MCDQAVLNLCSTFPWHFVTFFDAFSFANNVFLHYSETASEREKKKKPLHLQNVIRIKIIYFTELSEGGKRRKQHLYKYSWRLQSFLQAEWQQLKHK